MNKEEFIAGLEKMGLPRDEYIILSGGSLLMRGIREQTSDYDLAVSKRLAMEIALYNAPKDNNGYYAPFDKCQVMDDFEKYRYDLIDGYQCEVLEEILEFKCKMNRLKDRVDIGKIEKVLMGR